MDRLTVTESFLRETHEKLWTTPQPSVEVPLGVLRAPTGTEWFAPTRHREGAGTLCVRVMPEALRNVKHTFWRALVGDRSESPRIEIALFRERGFAGAVIENGDVRPISELWLQGPRFETWHPGRTLVDLHGVVAADGAFSRYHGALGGDGAHARMVQNPMAIVGVSRLGMLLATAAAKAGVRELILIDDDRFEEHHRDAFECLCDARSGEAKVEVGARYLEAIAPGCRVVAVPHGLERPEALEAVAAARLFLVAPDRGQPRLLAGLLASALLRPYVDVGTGVFASGDQGFTAGADVRYVPPGHGCVLCVGGVDLNTRHEVDFRRQRAGSLRSLNSIAAGLAWSMVERAFVGDLRRATWQRAVMDRVGQLRVESLPVRTRTGCAICAEAGSGQFALQPAVAPIGVE